MKENASKEDEHQFSSSDRQAEYLNQTRLKHSNEIVEDYVEAIRDLIKETGEARVVDLARRFGVTHATVNRTITKLIKANYVKSEPYRAIFLTKQGNDLAKECKLRHEVVVKFLHALGVPLEVARMDAEGIEHHISKETQKAFQDFLAKNK